MNSYWTISDSYEELRIQKLGGQGPMIHDLAEAKTWKGRIIAFFRTITGSPSLAEKNTRIINQAYGEGGYKGEADEGLKDQIIAIKSQIDKLKTYFSQLNKETLLASHWDVTREHPVDISHINDLKEISENLESITSMLCHKCQDEASSETNSYTASMDEHSQNFKEFKKTLQDTIKEIQKSEKAVAKLKKIKPIAILRADGSDLQKEFALFLTNKPVYDSKVALSVNAMLEQNDEVYLQNAYNKFIAQYAKKYAEAEDKKAISDHIQAMVNQRTLKYPNLHKRLIGI